MSKLTKLVLNPKKFINDSLWFKVNKLNIIGAYNNVFIISHLGQLKQVESLIEYENLKNNLLIILYTKKNLRVPRSIDKQKNKTLFDNSLLYLLPNSPNNYSLKSLVHMKRNYEELLIKSKVKNLYLLSFENHYSLLAKAAKKKGINLILLDEGTASYKTPDLSEYTTSQTLYKKQLAKILNVDNAFNWFTDFDEVYAAFPELLKQTFHAKKFHRFFAHAGKVEINDNTLKLIEEYKITKNDFIYVNQRYSINDNDFTHTILTILNKFSEHYNAKIFIKMHPKDRDNLKKTFIHELKSYPNIIFIKENEFLIEPAIQAIQPRGILGLTSTSLVYTPFISTFTKAYSIKPWFIDLVPKSGNEEGIKIINDHYIILEQFKHVISLNNEKDLELKNKNLITTISFSSKIYLEDAKQAYRDNKYYKSLVNFEWAYPKGIESMAQAEFVMYLDSVRREQGIKQTQIIIRRWIEAEITRNDNRIEYYSNFIKLSIDILKDNYEYVESIYSRMIYIDIIALITQKLDISNTFIHLQDVEFFLINNKETNLIPLLSLRAKQYLVDLKCKESLELLNRVVQDDKFVSENESIYLDILECLIYLQEDEKIEIITQEVTDKVQDELISAVYKAMLLQYEKQYEASLEILLNLVSELSLEDKKDLKVELLIAKVYRELDEYQNAKSYLISFEKHSKGNILCHREIAYLEYKFENYKKAIHQFNRAYPKGIESMAQAEFVMYLDSLYKTHNIKEIRYYLLIRTDYEVSDSNFYYLITEAYFNKANFLNLMKTNIEIFNYNDFQRNNLVNIYIKLLRENGKIDLIIDFFETNKLDVNILKKNVLSILAEVYELTMQFKKSNQIWKKLIIEYPESHNIKYFWDKFYCTVR